MHSGSPHPPFLPFLAPILLVAAVATLATCGKENGGERVGQCAQPARSPDPDARQVTRGAPSAPGFDLGMLGNVLPVLVVDTSGGQVIDEPRIDAVLRIFGSLAQGPIQALDIGIELRGGFFSMHFDKKQFGLVTRDKAGDRIDVPLLGMPATAHWVLSATPVDRALLRNRVAYTLGHWMGLEVPETRYVELLLNQSGGELESGDYLGLYLLTGNPAKNPAGLGLKAGAGGFLVELTTTDAVWPDEPWICAAWVSQPLIVHHPGDIDTDPAKLADIGQVIRELEESLFGSGHRPLEAFLDVDAAVDYWLLNEVLLNEDAFARSVFLHTGKDGRLVFGPAWDFDLAMQADPRMMLPRMTITNGTNEFDWGRGFLNHASFRERLALRWHELRAGPLAEAQVQALIDEAWNGIAEAVARNDARWSASGPVDGEETSADEEKERLKTWLATRFRFVDSHINEVQPGGS